MTDPLAPATLLFSPLQIAVASLVGGPVPACWLFARNYRALDLPRKARFALVWGFAGTAGLVALALFLPTGFPSSAVPIGYTIGLYQTAHQIHAPIVRDQRESTGRGAPWSIVCVVSVTTLLLMLAILLGIDAWLARG